MSDLSQTTHLHAGPRPVRAPQGVQLSCANWQIEAAYRMIQNNLDPAVAENPDALVVYGGIGKAARNWPAFEAILDSLRKLQPDETLLIQSGKPVGIFRTHAGAPRVLIANSNLVPRWATWEHFNELDRKGLMMFGQMTAGSWIYIGTQGIVQGTYETFAEAGRQHYGGELAGRWVLTAGLGGMGGAQPLAASFDLLEDATQVIAGRAAAHPEEMGASAVDYMRLFALTAVAYLFARAAEVALPGSNEDFHRAKLSTARFYMQRILPDTAALHAKILAGAAPVMGLDEGMF